MKVALVIISVIAGIIALIFLSLGTSYVLAPFRGAVEQQQIMESGGSRIYNYNRFFRLCSNIQTYEDQLDAQMQELQNTSNSDREAMIHRNISGLTAQRADAINTYNAEARAVGTGGRFRDDSLPVSIERNMYNGNNKTRCN